MKWFFTIASLFVFGLLTSDVNANNVTASISGGNLYVYGDGNANDVKIESSEAGRITVSGSVSTVNGSNAPVTLNGWTNGIFVYLASGNDSLWLQSGDVRGVTHIDLGAGDDDVLIGDDDLLPAEFQDDPWMQMDPDFAADAAGSMLRLNQSLTVLGFAGQDRAFVANCTVVGYATFNMGDAADDVYLGTDGNMVSTFFRNSVLIIPGAGADIASVSQVNIARDLTIDDPTNASMVDVFQSGVGGNLQIFTSPAVDNVIIESVAVTGLLKAILKDATDRLTLIDVSANRMEAFLGSGNDNFNGTDLETPALLVFLEDGADKSRVQQSAITNSYYYGAGGDDYFAVRTTRGSTAYVYGDAGTDTLLQSGNSIGKVNTYSIERKL